VNDQNGRHARLRNTATGALAALAAVGAIAGTAALAAKPRAKPHRHATHRHATAADGPTTKPPGSPADKTNGPKPAVNHQPFLNAIQQFVDNGTITAREGRTVDSEIQAGRVDTDTLTSSGFTHTELEAVTQALSNTKRALGPTAPPPRGPGKNSTPQQHVKHRHS
jgi:hypothetical protein